MADQFFSFVFTKEQLIALLDASANHYNPWDDEEPEVLRSLGERFAEALKNAQDS